MVTELDLLDQLIELSQDESKTDASLDLLLQLWEDWTDEQVDNMLQEAVPEKLSDTLLVCMLMTSLSRATTMVHRDSFYTRVRSHLLTRMPEQQVEGNLRGLIGAKAIQSATEAAEVLRGLLVKR